VFISWLLFTSLSWRVYSINAMTHDWNYYGHFDAVFYSLSQVVQGKTILVDLPSSYGLFPELIAPLFKIIGLSVFKFSIFMWLLQIISLISLFYLLTKIIKNTFILFIVTPSIILMTFANFGGVIDAYYQYCPIRFFWPAISVLLFFFFCKNKSIYKSALISFTAAIASIWNFETGIMIFISYAIYLLIRFYFLTQSKQINFSENNKDWVKSDFLKSFILHILIFLLTISIFLLCLNILSNKPLNYSWLYEYQHIFYLLG